MSTYSTADAWYSWTDAATTSCSYSSNGPWSQWVTCDYNSSTTATNTTSCGDTVWVRWTGEMYFTEPQTITVPVISEEQAKADRIAREEAEKRAKKLEEEKIAAEEKAKELLLELIGEEELKVYEETGRLFVKGRRFDYIVNKDGFVQKIEKGKITDLCVHLQNRYKYPNTDNVVGMKLAIEGDEEKFLDIANHHSPRNLGELPRAACM